MLRILDITRKDLLQLLRDGKIFLFMLIMPVAFTFLFGYAFGGFSRDETDPRLPVGYLDEDRSWISQNLLDLLADSEVVRLEERRWHTIAGLEREVSDENLAAAIVIPHGYGQDMLHEKSPKLILIADTGLPVGSSIESEVLTSAARIDGAVRTANILEQAGGGSIPFEYGFSEFIAAWEEPPIRITESASASIVQLDESHAALSHVAPGMMLQFAIAGLLTSAQIIVTERKSRSLQRMLTTATPRMYILLGHYLTILFMILSQFTILIVFGQIVLKVNYMHAPQATALVAICSALCIAALGLLIGILAKSEEQAVIFSIIPMFVLSGIGGAWVPLEFTGDTFRVIGHISPLAWAMDGFKNISVRGLGIEAVLLQSAALVGYAVIFFALAVWRFYRADE